MLCPSCFLLSCLCAQFSSRLSPLPFATSSGTGVSGPSRLLRSSGEFIIGISLQTALLACRLPLSRRFPRGGAQAPSSRSVGSYLLGGAEGAEYTTTLYLRAAVDFGLPTESFTIYASTNIGANFTELAVTGADTRGLIYGLYQLSGGFLGVDPFWWHYDEHPTVRRFSSGHRPALS